MEEEQWWRGLTNHLLSLELPSSIQTSAPRASAVGTDNRELFLGRGEIRLNLYYVLIFLRSGRPDTFPLIDIAEFEVFINGLRIRVRCAGIPAVLEAGKTHTWLVARHCADRGFAKDNSIGFRPLAIATSS